MSKLSLPYSFTGKSPAKKLSKRENRVVETSINSMRRGTDCRFEMPPIGTAINGAGAAVTTDAAVNLMNCDGTLFEVLNIATSTITTPVWASTGLNIARDLTDDEGCEITQGITSRARHAYTVGTDAPVFFEVATKITDVSGTDIYYIGWRKAAAYAADATTYTDYAAIDINAGAIYTATNLASAGEVAVDTTQTWADTAAKTVRVEVYFDGHVLWYVDGTPVTVPQAFSFASGTVIVPYLHFQHASDIAETTLLTSWKCGLIG